MVAVQIEEKLVASWALCRALFKIHISQGLWCCYPPVNYHHATSNYSVLMAKLRSFNIGAEDILLESEAKIETTTLDDIFEGVDYSSTRSLYSFKI